MSDEIKATVANFVEWINSEFGIGATWEEETPEIDISINIPGQGHMYVSPDDGRITTKLAGALPDKLREALGQTPKHPAIRNSDQRRAVAPRDMPARDLQVAELTMEDVKELLCPTATDDEAKRFLLLCQARCLNPFLNEAYLIKYGGKAQMVVGKEAFMRKAELHPQYAGFKAGVIIDGDDLIYREGSFVRDGEKLIGGWAEVYRKDRDHPIRAEVSLKDYDSGKDGPWKSHKATMIRKVPLVQAMREAFPSDLSGCYDASEFREAIDIEGEVIEG